MFAFFRWRVHKYALGFVFFSPMVVSVRADDSLREHVILFHGIRSSSSRLAEMAAFLSISGYDVISIDYPSDIYPLNYLVNREREVVKSRLIGKKGTVHFVGHSMGGLLIRGILNGWKPEKLGRVVMIGTPNHGSEVADILKNNRIFKSVFGPSGQWLTTDNKQRDALLGVPDYHFGLIATVGKFDITMVGSMIIPGEDDNVVGVESVLLSGMDDYVKVEGIHTLQTVNPEVIQFVLNYLKTGKFKPESGNGSAVKNLVGVVAAQGIVPTVLKASDGAAAAAMESVYGGTALIDATPPVSNAGYGYIYGASSLREAASSPLKEGVAAADQEQGYIIFDLRPDAASSEASGSALSPVQLSSDISAGLGHLYPPSVLEPLVTERTSASETAPSAYK